MALGGGRWPWKKAPAAMCRKVIEAIDKKDLSINIWGNGEQTRSFMYIDDCVKGIDMITHCDDLIATPINLGSNTNWLSHQLHARQQGGKNRRCEDETFL